MTKVLLICATLFAANIANANCELTINRTACPGKETDAYKPYSGKNPTVEKGKATTSDACLTEGDKASKIVRKGTLSKKVVTVKFDGKDVGTKEDSSTCK